MAKPRVGALDEEWRQLGVRSACGIGDMRCSWCAAQAFAIVMAQPGYCRRNQWPTGAIATLATVRVDGKERKAATAIEGQFATVTGSSRSIGWLCCVTSARSCYCTASA